MKKFDDMIWTKSVSNDVDKICVIGAAPNITLAMRISDNLKDNKNQLLREKSVK